MVTYTIILVGGLNYTYDTKQNYINAILLELVINIKLQLFQ